MRQTFEQTTFGDCQQAYIGVENPLLKNTTLLSQKRHNAMFSNPYTNNLDTREDWETTPAGRAMLNMNWLWEPGEYPKKNQ